MIKVINVYAADKNRYQTGCAQPNMPLRTRLCWDFQLILDGLSACEHVSPQIPILPTAAGGGALWWGFLAEK